MMYRPKELMEFLQKAGIEPSRSLSQNFLIDGNIIRKIVAAASPNSGDVVLEIGPGPGALTQALLETGAKVVAVDKDEKLAALLHRFPGDLTVFAEDITQFNFAALFDPLLKGEKGKVIANLPYNITTEILKLLVKMHHRFSSLFVMVQKEAGLRFASKPGEPGYGLASALLQHYATVDPLFIVKGTSFYPKPNVDSMILQLTLKELDFDQKFEDFLVTAFSQKRKTLRKVLGYPIEGFSPTVRAEELSSEELYSIFLSSPKEKVGDKDE